jgi:hypothetical protein
LVGSEWGSRFHRTAVFGCEGCDASAFGVGDGLGTTLTKVQNLMVSIIKHHICS